MTCLACHMLMIAVRGGTGDDQNKQVLQNIKVKQSLYSRWKPVTGTSESIEMFMKAFEAAVGFVDAVFHCMHTVHCLDCVMKLTCLKLFTVYVNE